MSKDLTEITARLKVALAAYRKADEEERPYESLLAADDLADWVEALIDAADL